jgi:hypothetical protein
MELMVESDYYKPSLDEHGNYIDKIPTASYFKNGLRCPCGTRQDKIFDKYSNFATHIKSKHHQEWLQNLNKNKNNIYIENLQLKELVENQKKIISKMEITITTKSNTIDILTKELVKKNVTQQSVDLLYFD